jgi:DNA-binding LacI/PurR family transcriptional regulator
MNLRGFDGKEVRILPSVQAVAAKTSRITKAPPTVRDIARLADVAVGSVSRALNGNPDLNAAMRERILNAARELGYTPLRKRRTNSHPRRGGLGDGGSIGLICFGMEDTLVQLPVVSSAVHGIEEAVSLSGGTLMFANIPRGDRLPPFLADKQVSGVILKGPNMGLLPPESESELLRAIYRLPHVWLLGQLPNAHGDHCNFDHEIAGRLAANHLGDKGHSHVAFLNPKPGHAQFEPLKSAFINSAARRGMKVDVLEPPSDNVIAWPLPAVASEPVVEALVAEWAAARPKQRATAIAVGADSTAVQLYAALNKIGVRPGKDVGIISCNDERSLIMSLNPSLTTINVGAEVVGRNAVARLAWRLAHGNEDNSVRILVEPKLVVRDSVPTLR